MPATFASRWERAVGSVPERPFLVWDDGAGNTTVWTYAAFHHLVTEVAGWLLGAGVTPGDGVHLTLPNSPAFVALWLASARLGAWILPADPQSTPSEVAQQVDVGRPRIGVGATGAATAYADAVGLLDGVFSLEPLDADLSEIRARPVDCRSLPHPAPCDRAAVMFTSGTTSAPKGVVVTQANYAFAGDVMAAAAGLVSAHRHIVVLPLFHANAQYYSFASAISAGASVALMPRFSASAFVEQAAQHRVTHASLFAAPLRMILAKQARAISGFALEHVWYAQNITEDQFEQLSGIFGCRPRQLYGMTETIPAVLTNSALAPLPDAMGHPTLGCQIRVADPGTGKGLPSGEVGEIEVRGVPGLTLFDGYLNNPDATASSMRNGWFRTGDRALVGDDGYFRFHGRDSEVLKVAGENVSTVEVENVLSQHPDVLEAAVVGRADEIRDEVPIAFVVPAPGVASLSVAALEQWCSQRLSPAKRPREVHVVPELPRTSVGKIRKFMLTDDPPRCTPTAGDS